jgi:cobalamin biosynthesis Mg chelatase CobN
VPPTHQYLATYRYIEDCFGADVIVHVGTHGNLEFLPGKSVGLSGDCYPDIGIGDLPHLYIYNSDNPPEGTIAKRRSYAVLIDHMQTVMTDSDLYGELKELEERIAEVCGKGEPSIVVIGHGSRLGYNKEVVKTNAERLSERGYSNVYYGFNEFNSPSIEDAMYDAVKSGADEIAVLPMFIASGAHLAEEIPEKLGIPMNSGGGVSVLYGREVKIHYAIPVGNDPRLVDVLVKKLEKYGI